MFTPKEKLMLDRIRHWLRVTFRDACPDPSCHGHLEMYDDRPHRDSCPVCGKSRQYWDKVTKA